MAPTAEQNRAGKSISLATILALASLGGAILMAGPAAAALHVDCRGTPRDAPTVILEAGAFGTSADWDLVEDDLAAHGRVCAYDRAGVGQSPPSERPADASAIADELAVLLDTQGETRPVILVGHSNGALYIETFAARWPGRVAGLVYVNGVGSDDLDHPVLLRALARERCLSRLVVDAARLGLARLAAPLVVKWEGLTGEAAARKKAFLERLSSLERARDEDVAILPSLATTRALGGSPPQIPTVVIVGQTWPDAPDAREWRAAEIAPAERARASWILEANGASHVSPLARDRAYVDAAVAWLASGVAEAEEGRAAEAKP